MERILSWSAGELDEIELVYEKASENDGIGELLSDLEKQCLAEARSLCGLFSHPDGSKLSAEEFDSMPLREKEHNILSLGESAVVSRDTIMNEAKIQFKFGALVIDAQACAIMCMLNRLEKLDGSINVLKPNWVLELMVPVGGRKGLGKWGMLIMMLYPWISISEVAYQPEAQPACAESKSNLYELMKENAAFISSFKKAADETAKAISDRKVSFKNANGPITVDKWYELSDTTKMDYILAVGKGCVTKKDTFWIDAADEIPNIISLTLLNIANSGDRIQKLDLGNGTDCSVITSVLGSLLNCCEGWDVEIVFPTAIKVTGISTAADSEAKGKEGGSFFKKLFGK